MRCSFVLVAATVTLARDQCRVDSGSGGCARDQQAKPNPNAEPETILPSWPDGAPGALGQEDGDRPTLTIYRAPGLGRLGRRRARRWLRRSRPTTKTAGREPAQRGGDRFRPRSIDSGPATITD